MAKCLFQTLGTLGSVSGAELEQCDGGAHARIDRHAPATMTEFDAIRGLAGLGALWLRRAPQGDLVRDVLTYLVRLTEPSNTAARRFPGWWTHLAPTGRWSADFPDGHANNGMAHGIS